VTKSELRVRVFGKGCHLVVENQDGQGDELLSLCEAELTRLENKFCSSVPESITSQINQSAGTGCFIPLDAEARSLFDFVDALWGESKRQFDPTIRILQECYDEGGQLLASAGQLQKFLKLVGWRNVEVDDNGAHLAHQGMLLDLNSCVRPYALDSIRKILQKHNVGSALIEMGQEAITIGKQPDGSNWLVGARAPMGPRGAIFRLKLNDKGFAVRGEFEHASTRDGEYYGRALSPIDGLPIPGLLSITVIAENCLTACSAANVARLRTEASGIRWLEKLGLPWMAVDRQMNCHGPLART
jgi:thiamine biosynthesis lipoprotein